METIEYSEAFAASSLSGRAIAEEAGSGLPDVQVAIRMVPDGFVTHVHTDSTGAFSFQGLSPGVYKVVTCLDGFDALDFRVRVSPDAKPSSFLLQLGPSETDTPTILKQMTQ